MTKTIDIPYGHGSLRFSLPDDRLLGVLRNKAEPAKSIDKLVLKALRDKDIPFRKKKVLIVVPDATRSGHLKAVLPILLKKISVPSRAIDIIVATGLHKRHTPLQLQGLLGANILNRYKVIQHDPYGDSCLNSGQTEYGVPATLNKVVYKYDFIISIGIIEPHLYAGYSGGAKTIAIGLAGEPTINATHSIKFLDNPSTNIGLLEGNPFQETLWHLIKDVGPIFSINIINDADGNALKVFAGPIKDVFKRGADFAKSVFEVRAGSECDIAICGVGHPKDINLYQASRAINYILNVDRPVVRKGGVVIVAAQLEDGAGASPAEKRFYEELKNMRSAESFVNRVKTEGCIAGEHRAYMVAKAILDYKVIFVTGPSRGFMEGLPIKYCKDLPDALRCAEDIVGKDSKIYVVPRALAAIAVINP